MRLPYHPTNQASWLSLVIGWAVWSGLLGILWLLKPAPATLADPAVAAAIGLGAIGLWRYGWAFTHLVRALIYHTLVFPRLRACATAHAAQHPPQPIAIVVTSYRMPPAVFTACYRALLLDAVRSGGSITVIAAVTDTAEETTLAHLALPLIHGTSVSVHSFVQDGTGKRAALAEALRRAAHFMAGRNGTVVLMDGDSLVQPGTLRKLAGIFEANPRLGAVTSHYHSLSDGTPLIREWHSLRMAQRHILMLSQSLSRRVLVLTGRFSAFRADVALTPAFIQRVGADALSHWRYGTVPFLTGDDKSTWFEVLSEGWEMRYLPDLIVTSIEPVVGPTLFRHSIPLMRRWFGNMLRTLGRARALGPRRMPLFTWWSLVDQTLSMWTALLAPLGFLLLGVTQSMAYLWLYAVWVLITRMAYGALLGCAAGRLSPWWPFLLFYNQVMGAWLKIHILFRLPHQRWTRQPHIPFQAGADGALLRRQYRLARAFELTAWLVFVWMTAWLAGLVRLPATGF